MYLGNNKIIYEDMVRYDMETSDLKLVDLENRCVLRMVMATLGNSKIEEEEDGLMTNKTCQWKFLSDWWCLKFFFLFLHIHTTQSVTLHDRRGKDYKAIYPPVASFYHKILTSPSIYAVRLPRSRTSRTRKGTCITKARSLAMIHLDSGGKKTHQEIINP